MNFEYSYHCEYCRCPIEVWEPLKTYKSDRSCELFSDFDDVIQELEKRNKYNYNTVVKHLLPLKDKYSDVEDFEKTIQEFIEIQLDLGVMTNRYSYLSLIK